LVWLNKSADFQSFTSSIYNKGEGLLDFPYSCFLRVRKCYKCLIMNISRSSKIIVGFLVIIFVFLFFLFLCLNHKTIGFNHLPLNFSNSSNCTASLLDLHFENSICLIDKEIYVRFCQGIPLFTSCVLATDVDFHSVCKHLPLYLHNAKSISDGVLPST
jgi:hypothetical protein